MVNALTWTNIQFVRNRIQLLLAIPRKLRALGQELSNQAADVLVTAALLWAVRVGKVDCYTRTLGDFSMTRHLSTLVVGQRFTCTDRHPVQGAAKTIDCRVSIR